LLRGCFRLKIEYISTKRAEFRNPPSEGRPNRSASFNAISAQFIDFFERDPDSCHHPKEDIVYEKFRLGMCDILFIRASR
jgi:hypothetical protein